ncbi:MAG: hypothetical protein ACOCXJ_07265, partial [Planctomycetota bacterium]
MVYPDLPGLPYPLWVTVTESAEATLLPAGCAPAPDRLTWLLLIGVEGELPVQYHEQRRHLGAGQALLTPYPDAALALLPSRESWRALAFGFVGMDDLVRGLIGRCPRLQLPASSWASRQLQKLEADPG